MKMRNVFFLAILCCFGVATMKAQVTFRPGLKAGLNFAHFSNGDSYYDDYEQNNLDFKSRTDFYIGMYGALKLTKFYTLQPEIMYSRQGSEYSFYDGNRRFTRDLEVSYLSLLVVNKFTFNKFNVHVGPTLDFEVERNFDTDSSIDLAFVLGAGYAITNNFGIEARVKKGIVPVLDYSDGNHSNVVFQLGATYTFDVK